MPQEGAEPVPPELTGVGAGFKQAQWLSSQQVFPLLTHTTKAQEEEAECGPSQV